MGLLSVAEVVVRARFRAVAALLTLCLLVAGVFTAAGSSNLSSAGRTDRGADPIPYLGLAYVQLSHGIATRYGIEVDAGLLLTEVVGNGPAARSGLRRGDVLLAADSVSLGGSSPLVEVLRERQPGDRVVFQVLRGGETLTVELALGAQR